MPEVNKTGSLFAEGQYWLYLYDNKNTLVARYPVDFSPEELAILGTDEGASSLILEIRQVYPDPSSIQEASLVVKLWDQWVPVATLHVESGYVHRGKDL